MVRTRRNFHIVMNTMVPVVALLLVGTLASAAEIRSNALVYGAYFSPKPPRPSGITEFPGMVSLHYGDGEFCAGSVLDELHVLTTGRCGAALESAASSSSVRSGSSYASAGGQVHSIVNISVHPSYNPRNYDYDVAVLKIDAKTPFAKTQIVPLTQTGAALETYQPLNVYGWGYPTRAQNFSVEVQPFFSRSECNRFLSGSFSPVKLVTERMLCTLIEPRHPKTFNFGSPAVTSAGKQVAISSWNRNRPDDICTMFTDLSNKEIQDFIVASL